MCRVAIAYSDGHDSGCGVLVMKVVVVVEVRVGGSIRSCWERERLRLKWWLWRQDIGGSGSSSSRSTSICCSSGGCAVVGARERAGGHVEGARRGCRATSHVGVCWWGGGGASRRCRGRGCHGNVRSSSSRRMSRSVIVLAGGPEAFPPYRITA